MLTQAKHEIASEWGPILIKDLEFFTTGYFLQQSDLQNSLRCAVFLPVFEICATAKQAPLSNKRRIFYYEISSKRRDAEG